MNTRTIKIAGLKLRLFITEFEAAFCDVDLGGVSAETRRSYRDNFVPQITEGNENLCKRIAELYTANGNAPMQAKYLLLAQHYARASISSQNIIQDNEPRADSLAVYSRRQNRGTNSCGPR